MRWFVTGGAGFIGSSLVDALLAAGHAVTVYDNFSTGQRSFLGQAACSVVEGDVQDQAGLARAMAGHDGVFHLAANADVRHGTEHPRLDLEQNTVGTLNVLEAMRTCGVQRIAFSSTGSVYGEPEQFPTPEACAFPVQTSLYGASKLAGEALISAYVHGYGFQATVFRFVSILGERYTHGHVFDFYRKLREDPSSIEVLGNGQQRKSYLYVGWICEDLGLTPERRYTGGERGWIGDSPFIFLDCSRIRALGWQPRLTIRDAVLRTLAYLKANPWLFEARS